ncbi:MAG: TetR/AcrR family transcriptional regulator [Gammaproteobacteria bacterium]|nr:TetR/AcrR family transcriptional regulator [Rhodocyclaceae bacterium]MBU3908141.1 TetR/AcrR family transcriptional regulator [Gammaproteobacteria bacterium]MBU3989736.1 TetR/AcrR family transcriptional regulator [Gammaproteobacteria bacterium]MBU4005782.1 TetR/AcrR family transcriptional regulator [Gammaproteobacteria bacterium]MBU4021470.1 TetR/AcrR family transcriptional regulator [Gammaproteobacteria bacterium]
MTSPSRCAKKTTHRRRKEARPGELTAAALDLFVEKGYAATRLDDVAARAGVSKGTLYLYFDGKEALFKAVVREGILPALAEGESLVAGFAGNSEELLRAVVIGIWRLIGSQRLGGIPKLIFAEAGNFPEIASFYHEEVIQRGTTLLSSVIERGIARGEFRAVDVHVTVHLVIAPVLMRMIWRHSIDCCAIAGVTDEGYFAEYFEIMLRGLRKSPSGKAN